MISELSLIRSYSNFWRALLPGGEDYVRIINSGLGKKIYDPININDKPHRRALINNISFSLFEKYVNKEITPEDFQNLNSESDLIINIAEKEKKQLENLRFGGDLSLKISDIDFKLIKWISDGLIENYAYERELVIRPKFQGCGILFEAEGDIIYGITLSELKSGDRNFGIQDLRQLYVYLALNSVNPFFEIKKIELFNPRKGLLWQEFIDVVSENVAGSPTVEILNEIIGFVSNEFKSI